jgi:hypothetical protein
MDAGNGVHVACISDIAQRKTHDQQSIDGPCPPLCTLCRDAEQIGSMNSTSTGIFEPIACPWVPSGRCVSELYPRPAAGGRPSFALCEGACIMRKRVGSLQEDACVVGASMDLQYQKSASFMPFKPLESEQRGSKSRIGSGCDNRETYRSLFRYLSHMCDMTLGQKPQPLVIIDIVQGNWQWQGAP